MDSDSYLTNFRSNTPQTWNPIIEIFSVPGVAGRDDGVHVLLPAVRQRQGHPQHVRPGHEVHQRHRETETERKSEQTQILCRVESFSFVLVSLKEAKKFYDQQLKNA